MFDTMEDDGLLEAERLAAGLQVEEMAREENEPEEPQQAAPERIPTGLDQMHPTIYLAAILDAIDMSALSGHDQIVVLRAQRRMASYYQARAFSAMAAVTATMAELDGPDWAEESAAAEIRAALRLTRRAADRELDVALELARRLRVGSLYRCPPCGVAC